MDVCSKGTRLPNKNENSMTEMVTTDEMNMNDLYQSLERLVIIFNQPPENY